MHDYSKALKLANEYIERAADVGIAECEPLTIAQALLSMHEELEEQKDDAAYLREKWDYILDKLQSEKEKLKAELTITRRAIVTGECCDNAEQLAEAEKLIILANNELEGEYHLAFTDKSMPWLSKRQKTKGGGE